MELSLFYGRNDILPKGRVAPIFKILPVGGYVRGFVHLPGGRHLDVGCGAGQFLEVSRSLGMDAYGIEPSRVGAEAAQAKGFRVVCGTMQEGQFPAGYFDLITMNHVFEHVEDPKETLIEASRILKPGGRIIIATPNASSVARYMFGKYWFQLDSPRHLQVFTPSSMATIADEASLTIVDVRWIGNPLSLAASLYNLLVQHGQHSPRTPLHKVLVNPLVRLLLVPVTALLNVLRLGDTMEVWLTHDSLPGPHQAVAASQSPSTP